MEVEPFCMSDYRIWTTHTHKKREIDETEAKNEVKEEKALQRERES